MFKKIVILALMFMVTISNAYEVAPHHFIDSKNHGKLTRKNIEFKDGYFFSYFGYIPQNLYRKNLYVVFHGEYSKSERFLKNTHLHKSLIKKGIFIAPDSFSDDWFRKNTYSKNIEILSKFIPEYVKNYGVKNIYFIGYSSGGQFAYNLACKINLKVDGIVLVNGSISKSCEKEKSNISFLKVIGEKDDFYTYSDKTKRNTDFKLPSESSLTLRESEDLLGKKLECENPSSFPIAYYDDKEVSVVKKKYLCSLQKKNEFEVIIFKNMGHSWPMNNELNFSDFRGDSNNQVDLGNYIINFFN